MQTILDEKGAPQRSLNMIPGSALFRRRRHMYSFVPRLTSTGRLGRPPLLFLTVVTVLQTLQMSRCQHIEFKT